MMGRVLLGSLLRGVRTRRDGSILLMCASSYEPAAVDHGQWLDRRYYTLSALRLEGKRSQQLPTGLQVRVDSQRLDRSFSGLVYWKA